MDDRNASGAIGKLFSRAGFNDLAANSLRKFNSTALTMSGMGSDRIRLMQGKHQQSSTDHYIDAEAEDMMTVYREHYEALAVEDDAEQELQQLQERQEHTNGEMSEMKAQLAALTDQLEYMRQTAGGMGRVSAEEARMNALLPKGESDPGLEEAEYRDFIRWKAQRDKAEKEAQE